MVSILCGHNSTVVTFGVLLTKIELESEQNIGKTDDKNPKIGLINNIKEQSKKCGVLCLHEK